MRRAIAQWWRNRQFARIGDELENAWRMRRSLEDYEIRLMREHQALQTEELNAKTPTCRGRHGY